MEIKVTQCEVGRFNLCDSERTLSFYMAIKHENKTVQVDGVDAVLHFSGDPDELYLFQDAFEDLYTVVDKCLEYSNSIISSTDYRAQCVAFAKAYTQNFEEINATMKAKKEKSLIDKIERLQKELNSVGDLPNDLYENSNAYVRGQIAKYKKWQDAKKTELDQVKEGTEKYAELQKGVDSYQQTIDKLTSKLIEAPLAVNDSTV